MLCFIYPLLRISTLIVLISKLYKWQYKKLYIFQAEPCLKTPHQLKDDIERRGIQVVLRAFFPFS